MAKPVRYKDGTLIMPGSDAYELYHNPPKGKPITPQTFKLRSDKKVTPLSQHMDELDAKWRKLEGRKPVAELTEREKMFEGKIPWNPNLLKEEVSFQIYASDKTGLNSPESYVVVRDGVCYLRILGKEPQWTLMSATANEDDALITVCRDQQRLIEASLRLAAELEVDPSVTTDRFEREYVKVCTITQHPGVGDKAFNDDVSRGIRRFFELYDSLTDLNARPQDEMVDLHRSISGDGDDDVYLSDGLWLSADGSLHDRGR